MLNGTKAIVGGRTKGMRQSIQGKYPRSGNTARRQGQMELAPMLLTLI